MTGIWIDPVELAAEAALLGELGARVQETVTGTRSACTCAVPRALEPWLDAELTAIVTDALTATVALLLEAMELQLRADGVTAEQSLVAATPALTDVATGPVFADTTMGGFSSYGEPAAATATTGWGGPGFLLGEVTPMPAVPSTGWGGPGFLLGEVTPMPAVPSTGWGGPGFVLNPYSGPGWQPLPLGFGLGAPGGLGSDATYVAIKNITAEDGIDYIDGTTVVDDRGRRGTSAQIYVAPDSRRAEVI